jgi:hypothetical protein
MHTRKASQHTALFGRCGVHCRLRQCVAAAVPGALAPRAELGLWPSHLPKSLLAP